MIPLHLLTDNGFKFISDLKNSEVYNSNFKLKSINYINSFDSFYFPCYKVILSTGLTFTCRSTQIFKGLIFKPEEIKNELDHELISLYNPEDYIFTSFPKKNIVKEHFCIENIEILNSLKSSFYLENFNINNIDNNSINKLKNLPINVKVSSDFYKFLALSLIRGKIKNIYDDINCISYKFNKNKINHERMKLTLIRFFDACGLNYEIREYDKYYYINYIDSTLTNYVDSLLKEDYNRYNNLFNSEYQNSFILYLYIMTNNTFYMSIKSFLFFKSLAYNNNLVLIASKNPIKSNHKFSLVTRLQSESKENYKEIPDVIFLKDGYLTKIESLELISKQGDSDYLPEYLLVC